MENVDEYIYGVLDAILGKGAQTQAKAFKEGFSKVFPITDLQAFSADELVMLFGNTDEDWSVESRNLSSLFIPVHSLTILPSALVEVLKADHGFNVESRAIRDLVEVMSSYDPSMRRAFLQFITGSPKLPIGGMYHPLRISHVIYLNTRIPRLKSATDGSTQTS
jgi:E3 ubiquitin-protein ligase TRIP12